MLQSLIHPTSLVLLRIGNAGEVICGIVMLLGFGIALAAVGFWVFNQLAGKDQNDLKQQVALLKKQVSDMDRRLKQLAQQMQQQAAASETAPDEAVSKPALPVSDVPPLPGMASPVPPAASQQAVPPALPSTTPDSAAPSPQRVQQAMQALKNERTAAGKAPSTPVAPAAPATPATPATKPAKTSVEERLGTGVFIWVGGICLILAGAFFVKYSFDNNLVTPQMRVILGTLFGLGLLGAAQYMHNKSRRIASSLAGAGVADLFACLLASSHYEFINTPTAFVLMIVVTGIAILLSLRHGRLVAILGLIGGFVTPSIIGSGSQHVGPLLAYLLLLQVAMTLVSSRRAWVGMTTLTMAGGLVWAVILMLTDLTGNHRFMLELFLIGSAVLYILSASRLAAGSGETRQNTPLDSIKIALSSVSAAVVLIGVLVYQGSFGVMDLSMLGLLGAALLVLARLRPAYGAMAWLAGGVSLCTLFAWILANQGYGQTLPVRAFWITTLSYGLLYGLGSYVLMWRSKNERLWAMGSILAAIGFFMMAMVGVESVGYNSNTAADILPWLAGSYDWALIAGVLGVLYALLSYPVWRARLLYLQGNAALGLLVTGSAIFFVIASHRGLDFPWQLSVWAGLAAVLAYLVRWQRILYLGTVATMFGVLTMLFLMLPGTAKMDYSDRLILNAILPAYALPALALGLAAWFLRAKRDAKAGNILRLLAIIIGAVGSLALVRHGYHPVELHHGDVTLYEWATYSVVALSLAHALLLWHRYNPGWPQQAMAAILLALGLVDVFLGAGLIANPLWHSHSVGNWPVLNGLLYIYGLPAILIALLLLNRPHTNEKALQAALPGLLGCLTFVLVFALVSLQVRQYFHHPLLNTDGVSNAEMYSYSVAWIILGIVLVAIGIRFKSKSMRYASLVVMLIAIGKVFLLDTAHLEDLYRVISFLGLGVTLMALGYVYQKFVFRKTAVEV